MKYVIMFTSEPAQLADVPAERLDAIYGEVYTWFDKYGPSFADGGAELQPRDTAKTVRAGANGQPVITDGPYLELKEVIGAIVMLECDEIDEAARIAATWPLAAGMSALEIRPVMSRE